MHRLPRPLKLALLPLIFVAIIPVAAGVLAWGFLFPDDDFDSLA